MGRVIGGIGAQRFIRFRQGQLGESQIALYAAEAGAAGCQVLIQQETGAVYSPVVI